MSRRRHRPPQARGANPAEHDEEAPEMDTENEGPRYVALAVRRESAGWRLVEAAIPADVLERYTTRRHEPDALAVVAAKVEGHVARIALGSGR